VLKEGDAFPTFSLADQNGTLVSNESLAGSKYVIFFYPKDDTPGCTVEACEFRDSFSQFRDARVFGVSPNSAKDHDRFRAKFGLPFDLLVDEGHRLAEACGVWVEKSLYGKKYMGVARTTFLVGESGEILRIWEKVKPEGHAAEVLSALA
jgi:peroxiredoxin Q/BCP